MYLILKKESNLASHLACSEINFFVEATNPGLVYGWKWGLKIIPQAAVSVV